jgi:hypothetical protein
LADRDGETRFVQRAVAELNAVQVATDLGHALTTTAEQACPHAQRTSGDLMQTVLAFQFVVDCRSDSGPASCQEAMWQAGHDACGRLRVVLPRSM